MTDISGQQCRAARALLGWKQATLESLSGASLTAIKDFESGARNTTDENREKIRRALSKGGVAFIAADDKAGPGVRLAKP